MEKIEYGSVKYYKEQDTYRNMHVISNSFMITDKETGKKTNNVPDDKLEELDFSKLVNVIIAECEKCRQASKNYMMKSRKYQGNDIVNNAINNIDAEKKSTDYLNRAILETKILKSFIEKIGKIENITQKLYIEALVIDIMNNLGHFSNNINHYASGNSYMAQKTRLLNLMSKDAINREEEGIIFGKSIEKNGGYTSVSFLLDLPKVGQLGWHVIPKKISDKLEISNLDSVPDHPYGSIRNVTDGTKKQTDRIVQNIDFLNALERREITRDNPSYIGKINFNYLDILRRIPKRKIKDFLDIEFEDLSEDKTITPKVISEYEQAKEKSNKIGIPILDQIKEICKDRKVDDKVRETLEKLFFRKKNKGQTTKKDNIDGNFDERD